MRRSLAVALGLSLMVTLLASANVAARTRTVRCHDGADLQQAIDRAKPGDTIMVRGVCRGNFVVDKDLILNGEGRWARLKGPGSGIVLDIADAGAPGTGLRLTARVRRLTIAGGDVGVRVGEQVEARLRRLTIRGNRTGLRQDLFSRVKAWYLVVSGNTGDGIENHHATLTLHDTMVSDNGGSGVSSLLQGGSDLYDTIVKGNGGRGIVNQNGSSRLVHSKVLGNAGGGIANSDRSYLTLRHSKVVGNSSAEHGGGVYIGAPSSQVSGGVTIEDSIIRRNQAAIYGGGIYREAPVDQGEPPRADFLIRTKLGGNAAGLSGGGIYNDGAPLNLTDVAFYNNRPNDCICC